AIVAVILAGCGEHHEAVEEHAAQSTPAETSAAPPPGQEPTAPATISRIDAPGIKALAADGRAHATLVNVWATWCQPCRQEFPDLLEAAAAHRADGLRLVLVSTDFDEQLPDVRRFLARH